MRSSSPALHLRGTLLFITLLFLCSPARAAPESVEELLQRRDLEVALLHLPIDRVVLESLPVWDAKTAQLRLRIPGEAFDDSTPMLILHLWATWCSPCKQEMGLWTELKERMKRQFGYDVRIVHIAMQRDPASMANFVRQQGDKMPPGAKYFDRDARLAGQLGPAFKSKELSTLPITLWLGPARTVRQALVGSIKDRESEVMESTERLIRSIQKRQEAMTKGLSKEEEWDTFTSPAPCACPCVCK